MEVSCRLPAVTDSSLWSAGRFNASRIQTWEFALRFLRGDHKAVKRVERPRPSCRGSIFAATDLLIITECYKILWFSGMPRRKMAADAAGETNRLPVAEKIRRPPFDLPRCAKAFSSEVVRFA
jgi:hypothetical protein